MPYKRVLLACDLHADSQHQAKAISQQFTAQLDLVCVAPDAAALGVITLPNMEHDILAQVKDKANALAKEIGIDIGHVYVKQGVVRLGMLEVAKDIGADLIVVDCCRQPWSSYFRRRGLGFHSQCLATPRRIGRVGCENLASRYNPAGESAPRNRISRTPTGPEGSNGSGSNVCRGVADSLFFCQACYSEILAL